jgi:hypothetical protein
VLIFLENTGVIHDCATTYRWCRVVLMGGGSDGPHMAALGKIMELMNDGETDSWMAARKADFDTL